jgi:hypothetical protein
MVEEKQELTDILQLASEGRASDILRDMRVRALYSNFYFVKVVLNYPELTDYFHQVEMENFIDRWAHGETKQWIEWSRGFFKSTCFTIGTSIWITLPVTAEDTEYAIEKLHIPEDQWLLRAKLHNQNARQLLAFETDANSTKKIGEIKWHFEENELFRSLFPEIAHTGKEPTWNNKCLIINRTAEGARHQEGSFEAIGVDGALQSRHYDIVWEDDLVGKAAVESDVVMAKTIRWHGLLHGCFVDAARQVRFGISNRWGFNDLNSHIRANEPDFHFHTRSAWYLDPVNGAETATFPIDGTGKERFTIENLQAMKLNSSMTDYDFSCQYLNSPRLPGDAEFNLSQLHKYQVIDGVIQCGCMGRYYVEQLQISMHYDPYNQKGVSSTSCPAIAVVGLAADKHVFLLDYFMVKGSYEQIYQKLYEFNDRWRPSLFTYEDVGHQNMTEFHIREMEKTQAHKDKHRRFPRVVPVPTGNKDKKLRIRDAFLPYIDLGKFSIRPKQVTFTSMLETFPNKVLDHDYDLLDCLAQGALVWRFPDEQAYIEREQEEDSKILKQLGQPYSQMGGQHARA